MKGVLHIPWLLLLFLYSYLFKAKNLNDSRAWIQVSAESQVWSHNSQETENMLQRKMDGKEFRMDVIFQKITHLKGVENMEMDTFTFLYTIQFKMK